MIRKALLYTAVLAAAASSSSFAASVSRDWQETVNATSTVTINRIQVYLAEAYDAAGLSITPQFELELKNGEGPYALRLANNTKVWLPGTTKQSSLYQNGSTYTAVPSLWGVPNTGGKTAIATDTTNYPGVSVTYTEPMQNWVNAGKNIAVMEAPSYIGCSFLGIREYWKTAVPAGYKVYYQFYKGTTLVDSVTYSKAYNGSLVTTKTGTTSAWNSGFININPVPEPGSIIAVLMGLGSLAGFSRRKK